MPRNQKIESVESLVKQLAELRVQGRRIVQCDGIFDLVHIGHIRHLEAARNAGDFLFVTVTPDRRVNRGPNRPVFSLELRMEALASLEIVDAVVANVWSSAAEAILNLQPDIFARGPDYQHPDPTVRDSLLAEQAAIEDVKGQYLITRDLSYRSIEVVGQRFSPMSHDAREYLHAFKARHSVGEVLQWLDKARELHVVVVGEAIIDEYQYVEAIGKSSKEPVLATRKLNGEKFAGGALAVANNIAEFVPEVELISLLGSDDENAALAKSHLKDNVVATFIPWIDAPTIVKRRYIESYSFAKLFEVYSMTDEPLPDAIREELDSALSDSVSAADVVVAIDFGHGMMSPSTIDLMCGRSRFLALNVQSNAGNHGFHTLSKYQRADFFSATENELRLEARDRYGSLRSLIKDVAGLLAASSAIVTRGKFGCLCFAIDDDTIEIPSLATEVVDRIGAGDAFFSVASLLAALDAPIELVGFTGNAASAQAVATIGHQRFLDRQILINNVKSLIQ